MQKSSIIYKQANYRSLVQKTYHKLELLKKKDERKAFNELILEILPELRKYINKRINIARMNHQIPKNKYMADDFIDQLFVEIYDDFDEIQNETTFYVWLFKKTNKILDTIIKEEERADEFLTNIDAYSKQEWDLMEEKFSAEADGDLVMLEDFKDIQNSKKEDALQPLLFEDSERDILNNLDNSLSQERIQKHIGLVLHHLPVSLRDVFELYTTHGLTLEEISDVKKISIDDAQQLLKVAKKTIEVSLLNRYS